MKCSYCGKPAEWVENKEIYGRNFGKSFMAWLCRPCKAYVGCHNNTKTPLGTIANSYLRKLRKNAHGVIDPLWKSGKYKRSDVYAKLSEVFGHAIHVGESNEQLCKDIIKKAELIFTK